MGVVGRLDQYASILATEFDDYSMSENLITYSEDYGNISFTTDILIAKNTIAAPDGNTTADTLIADINGGSNTCLLDKNFVSSLNTDYTYSVFLKAGTSPKSTTNLYFTGGTFRQAVLEITWGTTPTTSLSTTGGTTATSSLVAYPNGWYRAIITYNSGNNTGGVSRIYVRDQGTSNVSGQTVYAWGHQVEISSAATSYTQTTTTAISRVLPSTTNTSITGLGTYYSSGFDENTSITTLAQTGENLITYSEQFDNAAWSNPASGNTITANSVVAPDGTTTADLVSNVGQVISLVEGTITVPASSANDYYVTIYAKKSTASYFTFNCYYNGNTEDNVDFNFDTGTVTSVPYSGEYIFQPVGNGWYRCGFRITKDSTGIRTQILFRFWESGRANTSGNTYFWGAQLERGSVATDYIPTTTTSRSRSLASPIFALSANVFTPYDPVYDEFSGTLFGAGQGRYMRQNADKSLIVYNEIDEISDFRDIVRTGLVLDLDAGMNSSFNNIGTTWTDLSGNGNNGTLVNTPTYNTGNSGYFDFDYTQSENVTFSNAPSLQFLNRLPYTLESWVYPTSNPGANNWTGIFDREDSSIGSRDGYNIYFLGSATTDTTFATERFVAGSATSVFVGVDSSLSVNTWQHIVATYDGTTLTLYRNGSSVGTPVTTTGNITNTSKALTIGVRGGNYFGGRIANAKIYNVSLTSTEVLQNYNALKHRFGL